MYNVKGPSKIVAKTTTRRGIPQNMDNIREYTRNKSVESEDNEVAAVSKPVFYNKKSAPHQHRHEVISPQHEEIIKFINESWNKVCSEMSQDFDNCPTPKRDQSIYYEDKPIILEGFKPFDLESWWGKRLYACITGSANGKN